MSASCFGGIVSAEIRSGTPRLLGRVDPRAGLEVLEEENVPYLSLELKISQDQDVPY